MSFCNVTTLLHSPMWTSNEIAACHAKPIHSNGHCHSTGWQQANNQPHLDYYWIWIKCRSFQVRRNASSWCVKLVTTRRMEWNNDKRYKSRLSRSLVFMWTKSSGSDSSIIYLQWIIVALTIAVIIWLDSICVACCASFRLWWPVIRCQPLARTIYRKLLTLVWLTN